MDDVRAVNRTIFLLSVLVTGAVAGAFVWFLLFVMNVGITFIWDRVPIYLGQFYPLIVCLIGGTVIGLFVRRFGPYPENLETVMAKVKKDGRYEYRDLGKMSAGAILPLVFGGSVGPEAGLTGAIAAICTWVGDRLRRFGSDFRALSEVGLYAALSAIFTAPLYGFAGAMGGGRAECDADLKVSKAMRVVTYVFAIAGAMLMFLLLSGYVGGGLSLPRYTEIGYGIDEFLWLLPIAAVGAVAGWVFRILDAFFGRLSGFIGDRPVLKAVLAGLILGAVGMILPFTMFSGETQAEELNSLWVTMSVVALVTTGFIKIAVTALCVNMGWRGGHFFPVIFSGISIGYGLSMVIGVDPVFCICATTAAVVGGVMRRPLMAVLLLFLCFPLHSVIVLGVAAFIGSVVPLPEWARDKGNDVDSDGSQDVICDNDS